MRHLSGIRAGQAAFFISTTPLSSLNEESGMHPKVGIPTFYGLNVCVPLNSYVETLTANVMVSSDGAADG